MQSTATGNFRALFGKYEQLGADDGGLHVANIEKIEIWLSMVLILSHVF
jgi:hypothetical protein